VDKAAREKGAREPAFPDDPITAIARRLADGLPATFPRKYKKQVDEAFLRIKRERGEPWL
jgi:hypothetical protein